MYMVHLSLSSNFWDLLDKEHDLADMNIRS